MRRKLFATKMETKRASKVILESSETTFLFKDLNYMIINNMIFYQYDEYKNPED